MRSAEFRHPTRWALLIALACLPSPTRAAVAMFNGPSGFGTSSEAAEAAFEEGITRVEAAPILPASSLGVVVERPTDITIDLVELPSIVDPITATATWTVRLWSEHQADLWLVFTNPEPDPDTLISYRHEDVGIDIPQADWGLMVIEAVFNGSRQNFHYPVTHLGGSGEVRTLTFTMNYVIATDLEASGDALVLPHFAAHLAVNPTIVVAEPSAALLVFMNLGLLGAARRIRSRSMGNRCEPNALLIRRAESSIWSRGRTGGVR